MEGLSLLLEILSTANAASLTMVFAFGTLFGSFVNVCIGRLPVCKSIVWPGSACGTCGVPLRGWQNIPVISYLALGARCHWCASPFAVRYLLLELLIGGAAAGVFWRTHSEDVILRYGTQAASLLFLYWFTFSCLLAIVFFVDLDAWIILDEVNYFGIVVGIVGAFAMPPRFGMPSLYDLAAVGSQGSRFGGVANLVWSASGAALGFGLFFAIALLGSILARQEAMGQGDVKFAALIGAFLGPQLALLALLLSFPLGAFVALPLLVLRGKSGKTPLPFGTFMAVAAFAVMLAGEHVLAFFPFEIP